MTKFTFTKVRFFPQERNLRTLILHQVTAFGIFALCTFFWQDCKMAGLAQDAKHFGIPMIPLFPLFLVCVLLSKIRRESDIRIYQRWDHTAYVIFFSFCSFQFHACTLLIGSIFYLVSKWSRYVWKFENWKLNQIE